MTGFKTVGARIRAVATHLPAAPLTNEALAEAFEQSWSAERILEKTGIKERRVAASDETALDIAAGAVAALFAAGHDPAQVDFLIFCSQAPDYILPSSACILQERAGLPRTIGALDINGGCAGFVYGLSLATGLIASGAAQTVLLVTADTYSKYINPQDRSVRTLFGDGAAATLVCADDMATIGPFIFGTDGRGANSLIVESGGARVPRGPATAAEQADEFGNVRSRDNLFMDGGAVMSFTLREVPPAWAELKRRAGLDDADFDLVFLHQANRFMLDALVRKLKLDPAKVPYFFENIGNTVASSIPFALEDAMAGGRLTAGTCVGLVGFGVGLSWAGCVARF
ncbi:MAG TPA: ketoacyl-ACP synthase III [Sphingomonas sp.]|nr:ketoacyl-ACP synthase III [Sphingomonas sp.]